MSKTRNQNETIVIFGTGPTGLATAIETAKHASPNQQIVIITNRITHERNPIFRLNDQTYEYLQQLVGSDIMSKYTRAHQIHHVTPEKNIYDEESYYEIQIKSLESMLHEKLNEYLNSIHIISLQTKETVEIATDTAEVLLHDGRRIPFHYFIAADGAHHHIANQFIDQGYDLTYLATQQRQLHSFHAIGCYQTPGKYGTKKYHKLLQVNP